MALFEALGTNETLEDLAMANTMLTDFAAANLAASIESNKSLEKVNIESNNVSPQTLVKLFEVRILFVTLVDYCYQPFKWNVSMSLCNTNIYLFIFPGCKCPTDIDRR